VQLTRSVEDAFTATFRQYPVTAASLETTLADIVIINPCFDISFWGMENCIGLLGKRANPPVACLALLAALVPDHHDVTLIDENVEEIDFARHPQPVAGRNDEKVAAYLTRSTSSAPFWPSESSNFTIWRHHAPLSWHA
jgi:hypothetical protein